MSEMMDIKREIQLLSDAIQKTTELFYTQREAEAYQAFGMLLTPMANILETLFTMRKAENKPEFDEQEIVRLMSEAVKAMEEKDGVLLADILQYDFLDRLDLIEKQL